MFRSAKSVKIIHIAFTAASWVIFILSLLRLAAVWSSLPDRLGVHFSDTGEFDVFESKTGVFYPYIITLGALAFCEISMLLSKKVKTGLKISENGETKLRAALAMLLDIIKLGFSFFFSGVWADCVIRQRPLNTGIPAAVMLIMFSAFAIFIIFSIIIKIKDPPDNNYNK